MKRLPLLWLAFLLALPLWAGAELDIGNSVNIVLSPEHPKANERVSAEIESFSTNLDRAEIVWLLDGEIAAQGTGKRKFSFTTGALGSEQTLAVNLKAFDGSFFNRVLRIKPALVSLVWQAYSYTPPFYRGKALMPIEGLVSIIALPSFVKSDGERISPEEIIYTWRENGRVSGDGSGYGKFSFPVRGRIPIRPITVSVEAVAPDHGLVSSAETTIAPVVPQILFYEDRPLSGRSIKNALTDFFPFEGDEMRVAAVPYFFETPERKGALAYSWSVNNAPSNERGPDITLRRSGNDNGRAQLFLNITSPKSIFQAAEALLNITI